MFADIIELRDFYQSRLGLAVRKILCAHVAEMWPTVKGERVLVLGYGQPLLRFLSSAGACVHAFMPAAQGVSYWPREGPNVSCLVDLENLPLADNSVDRVIALHAVEGHRSPATLLNEAWRVMKSNGRFLTIVPNRRGLWAHSDRTPLGSGQPYSAFQIKRTLHEQGFLIERSRHALYLPPSTSRLCLSLADRIERYASKLFPGLGGVVLLEASKQLYAPTALKADFRHRLVLPLTLPSPVPSPATFGLPDAQ